MSLDKVPSVIGIPAKREQSTTGTVGSRTLGYEADTTAKIDLVTGMRVRRRSEKWPIYHIGGNVDQGMVVFCQWPQGNTSCCADFEKLQQLAADGKLLIVGEDDGIDKLPHILWRNAKQLVSLLEKQYGFGQKEI